MDQKLCKKCDIQKDLIFFNKDKSKNDGYRNSCKECQKNYSKNYYIDNKKNICESSNKYYKSVCHDINYQLNRKDYMVSYKFENFNKIKEYNKEYNEFIPEYKSTKPPKNILRRDCSYGTWKFYNYEHILKFRDILVSNMKDRYSDLDYFYTNEFLSKFSKFLYDNSLLNLF